LPDAFTETCLGYRQWLPDGGMKGGLIKWFLVVVLMDAWFIRGTFVNDRLYQWGKSL